MLQWTTDGAGWRLTLAGQWYAHVSIPSFQFLFFRWYFQLCIWFLFLWRVSRLALRLTPTHPDRSGGLGFLAGGPVAFAQVIEAREVESRVFLASLDQVSAATLAALRQLQAGVTDGVWDNLGGDIDGVWPGGDAVVIQLEQSGPGQTRVSVRVGGIRNRDATDRIHASGSGSRPVSC